jgi:hypothetical protein
VIDERGIATFEKIDCEYRIDAIVHDGQITSFSWGGFRERSCSAQVEGPHGFAVYGTFVLPCAPTALGSESARLPSVRISDALLTT